MSDSGVRTPCIGICSTTYGDFVCRGCKRFVHEVVDWNTYDDAQKAAVLERLHALRDQVVAGKLTVFDPERLRRQLERHRVPHQADASPEGLAWQLLRHGARRIRHLAAYGIRVHPEHGARPLPDLRMQIDAELQALAEAHYERFFDPARMG